MRRAHSAVGGVSRQTIVRSYDGADRAHVAVRLRTCPFAAIERALPRAGALVDIGCGHGHLAIALALAAPARRVVGVDVDERKLALARTAAARLGLGDDRVRFEAVASTWRPTGPVDGITVVDALYLLDPAEREALVRAAAGALGPGGVIVLKEMDPARRAKTAVARAGELVMTRLAHVTASSTTNPGFLAPSTLADRYHGIDEAGRVDPAPGEAGREPDRARRQVPRPVHEGGHLGRRQQRGVLADGHEVESHGQLGRVVQPRGRGDERRAHDHGGGGRHDPFVVGPQDGARDPLRQPVVVGVHDHRPAHRRRPRRPHLGPEPADPRSGP